METYVDVAAEFVEVDGEVAVALVPEAVAEGVSVTPYHQSSCQC